MCLHQREFGLEISSYNFFATSHGKSPCDAIGAVLKRGVAHAALRRPPNKQIRNAREMYEAAIEEIQEIR